MGNSTIIERWWLVTFASFVVIFLLFLNHSPPSNNISVLQNLTMPITANDNRFAMPNMQGSEEAEAAKSSNQFPISRLQSSCIPLNSKDFPETVSSSSQSQVPSSDTSQKFETVNPVSGLRNPNPSDSISSDNVKQATTFPFQFPSVGLKDAEQSEVTDKTEAGTTSSFQTQVPLLGMQNQEQPKDNDELKQETIPSFQVPFPGLKDSEQSEVIGKTEEVQTQVSQNQEPPKEGNDEEESINEGKECNLFEGKWVYDPQEYPLYDSSMCPFLSEIVSCKRNGRPDKEFEKWRWEPNDCKIPRFDAKDMLERLRGKRVAIIGDSINHGQFESLACFLYSAIPDKSYVDSRNRVFKSEAYDLEIQNHWAEFLVETIVNKTDGSKTLKLDSLAPTAQKSKGADIMVFNTGHWWSNRKRWGKLQYKRKVFEDMKIETAFKVAMKTWARWIERNVDPTKTKVFFRGMSPPHFGKDWCYKVTKPIMDDSYKLTFGVTLKQIVEKTLQGMRTPVTYLNITQLSGVRPDAHSSIYARKDGKLIIATKQKNPALVADCSHWCLPGVPDTWNHLLYATLVFDSSRDISTT